MSTTKTFVFMGALSVMLVFAGYLMFGGIGGATFMFAFSLLLNLAMYWFSDKIALAMSHAKPATEAQQPELYRIVSEAAAAARIPMPRVYTIESDSPNAFATGRNPQHAAVAFTTGIMRLLTREELAGVASHELAHVKNRDTLIMAVAAALAGTISYLAVMARWSMMLGGGRDRRNNGLGIIGLLVVAIVLPIAAILVRLAISRSREYEADNTGAHNSGRPWALADALEKLEAGSHRRPLAVPEGVSHLFIVNPLGGNALVRLFSTHPPLEERVRRLRKMAT